ncbi:MAG: thioredoxin domain-containing protein, partial [Nitrososphaeraceae archaeon]
MKKKSRSGKINKKAVILGIVLAVVIIGGSATAFLSMGQNNSNRSTQTSQLDEIVKKLTQPVLGNASALGSDAGQITLIEFGDYQCQECAKFHKETLSQIINNYVNTGAIKFLFKDFVINDRPSDKASTLAARASYCAADQGK